MIADQIIKPTEDIKELEQRPERKTTSLVLDLFKKCEDYAWVKLTELNIKKNTAMQYVRVCTIREYFIGSHTFF
jgi:hypothetical protein